MSTSNKLISLFILIIGLLSCASEEKCPIENASGMYTGIVAEKFPYEEADVDSIESVEVLITNITDVSATVMLGEASDELVFDVSLDGCSFSSEYDDGFEFPIFTLEGSFENDKFYLELINPIKLPEDPEDMYKQLEELEDSGKLLGASGEEIIDILNGLEGFSGFEKFETLKSIESLDDTYAIDEFLDILEYTLELAEYLRFDFTKI